MRGSGFTSATRGESAVAIDHDADFGRCYGAPIARPAAVLVVDDDAEIRGLVRMGRIGSGRLEVRPVDSRVTTLIAVGRVVL